VAEKKRKKGGCGAKKGRTGCEKRKGVTPGKEKDGFTTRRGREKKWGAGAGPGVRSETKEGEDVGNDLLSGGEWNAIVLNPLEGSPGGGVQRGGGRQGNC